MTSTRESMSIYGYTQKIKELAPSVFGACGEVEDDTVLDQAINLLDECYRKLNEALYILAASQVNNDEDED